MPEFDTFGMLICMCSFLKSGCFLLSSCVGGRHAPRSCGRNRFVDMEKCKDGLLVHLYAYLDC